MQWGRPGQGSREAGLECIQLLLLVIDALEPHQEPLEACGRPLGTVRAIRIAAL